MGIGDGFSGFGIWDLGFGGMSDIKNKDTLHLGIRYWVFHIRVPNTKFEIKNPPSRSIPL
jgi:hypothetical protein